MPVVPPSFPSGLTNAPPLFSSPPRPPGSSFRSPPPPSAPSGGIPPRIPAAGVGAAAAGSVNPVAAGLGALAVGFGIGEFYLRPALGIEYPGGGGLADYLGRQFRGNPQDDTGAAQGDSSNSSNEQSESMRGNPPPGAISFEATIIATKLLENTGTRCNNNLYAVATHGGSGTAFAAFPMTVYPLRVERVNVPANPSQNNPGSYFTNVIASNGFSVFGNTKSKAFRNLGCASLSPKYAEIEIIYEYLDGNGFSLGTESLVSPALGGPAIAPPGNPLPQEFPDAGPISDAGLAPPVLPGEPAPSPASPPLAEGPSPAPAPLPTGGGTGLLPPTQPVPNFPPMSPTGRTSCPDPCPDLDLSEVLAAISSLEAAMNARFDSVDSELQAIKGFHTQNYQIVQSTWDCENKQIVNEPIENSNSFALLSNAYNFLSELVLDLYRDFCEREPVAIASIPEHWYVRPAAARPQLVVVYREVLAPGKFGTNTQRVIPHYVGGEPIGLPSFSTGNYWAKAVFSDGSQIGVWTDSLAGAENLCISLTGYVKNSVHPYTLRSGHAPGFVPSSRVLAPWRADYYPNGQKDSTPTERWYLQ